MHRTVSDNGSLASDTYFGLTNQYTKWRLCGTCEWLVARAQNHVVPASLDMALRYCSENKPMLYPIKS